LNSRKDERMVYLSIWSQYRGQKEVVEIMADIDDALHRKALTLESGTMVQSFVQNKHTSREPDNLTFQGSVKLRIITQH
jgi:orotate phosphoribosyltransferase